MAEEKPNDNVVDDKMSNILNKIGITGIASALLTIVFGLFIMIYPITWDQARLVIGLYLLVVGVMNMTGYVISIVDEKKDNIYIETETLKTK